MSKIVFSKRRKVEDIKSLSDEELQILKRQSEELLERLEFKNRERIDIDPKLGLIACLSGVITFMAAHDPKGPMNPNTAKISAIVEGGLLLLAAADYIYNKTIRKRRIEREKEKQADLKRELDIRGLEIKSQSALKDLKELYNKIESDEHSEFRDDLVAKAMEAYLSEGADPELLKLPGIKKIFDIAVMPTYPNEYRVFIHNKDVRADGTFTIVSHEELPHYKHLSIDHKIFFEVRYCENGDDDHYIQVKNGSRTFYLDIEGNISEITQTVEYGSLKETASISIKDAVITPLKNLNATMAELRRREGEKTDNPDIPTIDFESIRKREEINNDGYSQVTDIPIINAQTGGFSR